MSDFEPAHTCRCENCYGYRKEMERVTAERDELAKGVNYFSEERSKLMTERDRLLAELESAQKECLEQARLNGMGAGSRAW